MNAIVAVDRQWGIGKDNDLLVHLPGDLKYYREKTQGKCVVFGQRTLESLPGGKPLPNRNHIVLSDDPNFEIPLRANMKEGGEYRCILCASKEKALEAMKDFEEVFICGGASIYELFMDECDSLYITRIDHAFNADRFFPTPEDNGFELAWESETHEDNGYSYTFCRYDRVK